MIRSGVAFVVILFVIGLSLITTFIVWEGFDDGLQASDNINASIKTFFTEQKDSFTNVWDYTFLTLFVAGLLGALILTWAVRSNPALFFFILMVVVVIAALAGYMSNAYATLTEDATFGAASLNFPITDFILDNYLVFMLSSMFLMLIVFFAKPNDEGTL